MKPFIITAALLFLGFSCSDLVEGINQDPNNPTSASYQYVLTGAEVGNIILQTGETARKAGIFCGYFTGIDRQHLGFSEYNLTTANFDPQWSDAYIDAYRNAVEAEKAAEAEAVGPITKGILQVLQAQIIGTVTSLYGDVPFEEAAKIEIEHPVFEDQVSIYGKLQNMLDQAIVNLESGTGRPAAGAEIYFDGNPAPWKEVAYTLKARYFMHTRDYAAAFTAASKGISAFKNSLYSTHGTGLDESNLNYLFFAINVRAADLKTSNFMASLVQANAAVNPIPQNYRGNAKTDERARYDFLFRTTNVGVQPNTLADKYAAQTAPSAMVTYQENLLILAEAGFRSQGFAVGLQRLNAFRAFMATGGYLTKPNLAQLKYDAYTEADFAPGGIENPDNLSADNALLREILEERYVTFFGQIEGFNDTRRTGKEAAVRVKVIPNKGNLLPQRFLYPQTEIDRNINVPKPIPGLFDVTAVNK